MKIVIVNSRNIFGGTLVLSALCKTLLDLGYDAKVFFVHDFPNPETNIRDYWWKWFKYFIRRLIYMLIRHTSLADTERFAVFSNSPVLGIKEKIIPFVSKNTVVIYPEVVYGNFLNAKYVVRWLLYYNKYKGYTSAFGKNDLVVSYRDVFNDDDQNPLRYYVKINYFNSTLYKQYNLDKRSGCCYIIRKGATRIDLPSSYNGPIIDGFTEEAKVKVLNQCQYCYVYDTQTFYSRIAAVCGCIPIVVLEEGKSKESYLGSDYEKLSYGVAYGNTSEEIQRAIDTRHLLLKNLNYKESNEKNALYLMGLIQKYFNLK